MNEDSLISPYRERMGLHEAHFVLIDHDDAMVATVFRVTSPNRPPLILKVCSRSGDDSREVYFLKRFADRLPVPRLIQHCPPSRGVAGAILMECLPGRVMNAEDLNQENMNQIGSLLAQIHCDTVEGYGDLTEPSQISTDPRVPFTFKFEEGMDECRDHLPRPLFEKCRRYYEQHVDLLLATDGPRVIHRDFRPGNLLIDRGNLQGIIDWSSTRGGFAEEDFCPLEFGEWSTQTSYKNAFLEGYASVRKIPDYQRIMPLLRLSRAIGAIGFTVKRGTWEGKGAKIYRFSRQYIESMYL